LKEPFLHIFYSISSYFLSHSFSQVHSSLSLHWRSLSWKHT
jgi:hypothetical protein